MKPVFNSCYASGWNVTWTCVSGILTSVFRDLCSPCPWSESPGTCPYRFGPPDSKCQTPPAHLSSPEATWCPEPSVCHLAGSSCRQNQTHQHIRRRIRRIIWSSGAVVLGLVMMWGHRTSHRKTNFFIICGILFLHYYHHVQRGEKVLWICYVRIESSSHLLRAKA